MIDIAIVRQNKEYYKNLLHKKEPSFPFDMLLELDGRVKNLQQEIESLRHEKKELSVHKAPTPAQREHSINIGRTLKEKEALLEKEMQERDDLWLSCPNIPLEDVPQGDKDKNEIVKEWKSSRVFVSAPLHHLDLNEKVDWFDLGTAAQMSGSQFVFYKEMGAKILYSLAHLMLKNNKKHGYTPVLPPYLVKRQALYNSGNLPKFEGSYYSIPSDDLCLIPTAEVSLTNMHAGNIISEEQLPLRYTAWTSCFRREAGGYGAHERGIIRIHQFEKVELYAITRPEDSHSELDKMVACAEALLQDLDLTYRISLLAGQDCSFSAVKTYDIEVFLPGQKAYYEVSSASNCSDFQARRSKIRYKGAGMKKPRLVHTLNASSLALPRLMIALMEQYQQADGSIILPPKLQEIIDVLW